MTGLRASLSTPDAKYRYVRGLFSTIADRYDLITRLLSFGRDRGWKRRLVDMSRAGPGTRAVDLASGTGDISFELAARGASVVGIDLTARMIELARAKRTTDAVSFAVGDMMALPLPDACADVVTAGYGLRNVPRIAPALAEIHRVLRPGGRFLSLDFNRPAPAPVRAVYLSYLTIVGSILGFVLHHDPDTYRYIPESIRRYPGAPAVCDLLRDAGFREARWVPVLGGLMAIHHAVK